MSEFIESSEQDLVWGYFYRGDAQFGSKKYDLAIESYQKALTITPDVAVTYFALGAAYAEQSSESSVQVISQEVLYGDY